MRHFSIVPWAVLLLALLVPVDGAAGQGADTASPASEGVELTVAVRETPPFVVREGDGWTGIVPHLLDAVEASTGLSLRIEERETLGDLLADVEAGRVDLAAAPLTVTAERESRMDFTQPFHVTGLAIAVPAGEERTPWARVAAQFLSLEFLKVVLVWGAVLLAVGFLVWVFERRPNPDFSDASALRGIMDGFWFSAVTMTTVGYGDKAPRTLGGRVVTLFWMFAALVGISSFTAAIASALTLGGLQTGIQGPDDLPGNRVGTVGASTSEAYLAGRGLQADTDPSAEALLERLAAGELEAVVYDAPILRYLVRNGDLASLRVLPGTFDEQYYAFALPEGSPHREVLNRAILDHVGTAEWRRTLERYLGP